MMSFILANTRIGSPVLGIILPALIFCISFLLTVYLLRHFMKQNKDH
ncbi:hypothetical protein JXB12_01745 [candidate division KSB1 bacterium]|nr:hypothetical protein [candidate division KSB1 bacterium]